MHEHPPHEHPSNEQTHSSGDAHETVRCSFCDQPTPDTETTQLHVGNRHSDPICIHCASSLFDTVDAEQLRTTESTVPQDDADTASDVTWNARRPKRGGITGYLLQYHYLSLSLLWSIHQTNVRLFERFLDEADMDLLLVVGLIGIVLITTSL